ncbi:unnamed protein product [Diamesa hyperborea]
METRRNIKATEAQSIYPLVLIKKLKLDGEYNEKVINSKTEKIRNCSVILERVVLKNQKPKKDKIILVNVKKNVILSPELLQKVEVLKMSKLIASFDGNSPNQFYKHCRQQLTEDVYDTANELTIEQTHVPLWFELRVGRITASSIYKITCITELTNSFEKTFLGEHLVYSYKTIATERGAILEDYVFKELLDEFPGLRKSGLVIDKEYPVIAASPDGIHDDFVLEIKCPWAPHTHLTYLDIKTLNPQYLAQIQLQMHITKKEKALLAVAAVDFEKTRNYTKVWIKYDKVYCKQLINDALTFYESEMFPKLITKFKETPSALRRKSERQRVE